MEETTSGEKTASVIDNLDLDGRLGLIKSADEWMTMRNLRNQMVHEYVEAPVVLNNALQSGHGSNSQFNIFRVTLGWEKPFEERRKPLLGGLAVAFMLPTSSKSFSQPFFPSN